MLQLQYLQKNAAVTQTNQVIVQKRAINVVATNQNQTVLAMQQINAVAATSQKVLKEAADLAIAVTPVNHAVAAVNN